MSNLKFKQVYKDKLFYNQYHYVVRFTLPEMSCLRHLDHSMADDILTARSKWRKTIRASFGIDKTITDEIRESLHSLLDEMLAVKSDHKLVINYNTGYIYTNDKDVLKKFYNLDYVTNQQCSQVVVNRPLDTVKLKRSQYSKRSYFRFCKITDQERQAIRKFLQAQKSEVRISSALNVFLGQSYKLIMDHYFIDYNNEGIIVMLSLIKPNLVRKTLDIIVA